MFCAPNVRRTEKRRKNCCSGLENRGRGRPREARANKFGRQNGQVGQKSALEVPPGPPKIYKWARTKQLRARKSAPQAAKARRGPKHPKRFSVISRWICLWRSYFWSNFVRFLIKSMAKNIRIFSEFSTRRFINCFLNLLISSMLET